MSAPVKLGWVAWHNGPVRGRYTDERPAGAYLSLWVGKDPKARYVELSAAELSKLIEDAAVTLRRLLERERLRP